MFTELLPLLKQRVLMITVSDVGDGLLRVNVIPRKLDADSDQSQALTTPLSITGSAEELDRELPGQLLTFTESVVKTGSNLAELKTQHAAAVKAVEAENKKRLDEKKKGSGSKTPECSSGADGHVRFQGREAALREQGGASRQRVPQPLRRANRDGRRSGRAEQGSPSGDRRTDSALRNLQRATADGIRIPSTPGRNRKATAAPHPVAHVSSGLRIGPPILLGS